jgi:hypothetical protein
MVIEKIKCDDWRTYNGLTKWQKFIVIGEEIPHDRRYVLITPNKQEILCCWDAINYIYDHIMHDCNIPPKTLVKSLFETGVLTTITEFEKGE